MKKRIVVLIAAVAVVMTACAGNGNTFDSNVEESTAAEETEIANPWVESDVQGVQEATGFKLMAPDGASSIAYSYNENEGMAQMTYDLDGSFWTYRVMSGSELSDISGMNYEWTLEESGYVGDFSATYLAYSDATEDTEYIDNVFGVQVVNWYDDMTGVIYSLSVAGTDINGLDIQVFAEELCTQLQEGQMELN